MKALYGEKKDKLFVKEQIKTGIKISEVTLGKDLFIHRYFFRTSYIGYSDIKKVYKRIEGGEYGDFAVEEYSVVIVDMNDQEYKLHIDRLEYITEIQQYLKDKYPFIKIGK